MSLYSELERCCLSSSERFEIQLRIVSFPGLLKELKNCKTKEDAVRTLKTELGTKCRTSFVARIVGRYHKLLSKELVSEAMRWRKETAQWKSLSKDIW